MRLIKDIAIVTILLLLNPSLSRADANGVLKSIEDNTSPAGYVSLDKQEQSNLANYIKQCEVTKLNLVDAEKTLSKCSGKLDIEPSFWNSTSGLVTIGVASFASGLLLGGR